MSDRVGEQFGEYRLTRKLGGGTFGDVYLGGHMGNKTPAAVKILQVRLTNSEDLKDYINELRSLFLDPGINWFKLMREDAYRKLNKKL
jgi:serine/threonine protein kinase